ncbi:MAG: DUF1573 domain-containing protein [Candidatus Omnitrophica bacterium]|nr:DUF1573 domain-containing protein [Candidatus Omnitrophota bacterium]
MKRIIFVAFLVFFLAASAFCAPQLTIKNKEFDLGVMAEGMIYEYTLSIQNTGDEDLSIDLLKVSCGCVEIIEPTKPVKIAPGEKTELKFLFNTTGFTAKTIKYIYIQTNDPKQPVSPIKLLADIRPVKEILVSRFGSFSWLTIVTAGLIDGINPCAFTVLIFFISFLTFAGYSRRQTIILGTFFITAVFFTYLWIGLGLFEIFRRLSFFIVFSYLIYLITAILALILGVVSLYDWWIFKKTKDPERIKLKLPGFIKKQIQATIRAKADDREEEVQRRTLLKLMFTALSSGFIVSLLESVCTGQLYLPTIVYVLGVPELKVKAWLYLILYNFMFVIPLFAIFLFALLGTTSETFAKIAARHLTKVKLLTAIVFFGLGIFLLMIMKH